MFCVLCFANLFFLVKMFPIDDICIGNIFVFIVFIVFIESDDYMII